MKTIEEKARAYDEVLNKLRHFITKGVDPLITRADVQDFFPELAESEGEKVRKSLITFFQRFPYTNLYDAGLNAKEVISWLEKQKNCIKLSDSAYTSNKDVIEFADKYSHTVWENLMDKFKKIENYSIGCNDVSDIVLNAIINTYNWLEKQKQQEKDILEDAILDGNEDGLIAETIRYKNEKQEMSYTKKDVDDAYLEGARDAKNEIEKQYEANYQTRKDIATFIFNYKGDIKDRAKWIDYLGVKVSFVEKQGKQKIEESKGNIGGISANSEWNEEDEQHIDSLLKRLDALCRNKFERTRFAISEDRDWLKSLKPQNKWKLSDEQIKVCKEVYADLLSAKGFDLGTVVSELNRLEEELKKAMEEQV